VYVPRAVPATPAESSPSRHERRAAERELNRKVRKLRRRFGLSSYDFAADDPNVTFSAAAPELWDLAEVVGLRESVNELVAFGRPKKGGYEPGLLAQLLIDQRVRGIDRVENSRVLGADIPFLKKLGLEAYPDPETFRRHLERYGDSGLEGLVQVNARLLRQFAQLVGPQEVALQLDTKVVQVHGQLEGAEKGYNPARRGRLSYCLKVATIQPYNLVVAAELCPGKEVSGTRVIEFYEEAVRRLPASFVATCVRADKGYYPNRFISRLEEDCVDYYLKARLSGDLRRHVDFYVRPEDYATAAGGLFQHATTEYQPKSWPKPRTFAVVRRPKAMRSGETPYLLDPFRWRYEVVVTNRHDQPALKSWQAYNGRAQIENVIKELGAGFFLTKHPSRTFNANKAAALIGVIAHNFVAFLKSHALPKSYASATIKTVRRILIDVPGRLVNRAGRWVMRLPQRFPYLDVLRHLRRRVLEVALAFS